MDNLRYLSPAEVFTGAVKDMADAISERPGETLEQRLARCQVATQMIVGLAPRTLPEAMLAGHGVMFHALLTDSIGRAFRDGGGTADQKARRSNIGTIVALSRSFHRSLDTLAQYRSVRETGDAEAGVSRADAVPTGLQRAAADAPESALSTQSAPVSDRSSAAPAPLPTSDNGLGADHDGSAGGDDPPANPANALTGARAANGAARTPHLNRAQRRQLRSGGWHDRSAVP